MGTRHHGVETAPKIATSSSLDWSFTEDLLPLSGRTRDKSSSAERASFRPVVLRGRLATTSPLKRDEIRFGQSGDGGGLPLPRNRGLPRLRICSLRKSGRPDLRWERVGVRGYGFSSEQRPLTRIALDDAFASPGTIRPLPAGEREFSQLLALLFYFNMLPNDKMSD